MKKGTIMIEKFEINNSNVEILKKADQSKLVGGGGYLAQPSRQMKDKRVR